ncbi:MAG: GNAT family N-acetyltransferase [Telluria sp.]
MTDIRILDSRALDALLPPLAELLIDAVADGASLGFLAPLLTDEAGLYWESVREAVVEGRRVVLVALRDGRLAGTVQLDLCMKANGVNRAEVQKLLVHSSLRRAGVARQLMEHAEAQARALRRGLLFLDTEAGSDAEAFYQACGYTRLGELPDYACSPAGEWRPTAIYFKRLSAPAPVNLPAAP